MFRCTFTTLIKPLYHRRALPTVKGSRWHGNWGAVSNRFYGKTCMSEAVTPRRSVAAIDRDMLNYVHRLRIRHRQMRRTFSEKAPTTFRTAERKEVHLRAWLKKVQLSYRAYMHYATMKTLRQQAQLVGKYGQAAVNTALGDYSSDKERQRLLSSVHRSARAPPVVQPVKKHVVTRFQKHNDRFDVRWRQNAK